MTEIVTAAAATGFLLTIAVPFVALHELLVKRHKANMLRHLPPRKRVNISYGRSAGAARPTPLQLTPSLEQAAETAPSVPDPPPPYDPRMRPATPPPAYEEIGMIRPEPSVARFAQSA
ncbi:hypothetical protein PMAYCL1PPCAC_15005 [Pristionchus mayeri]|uniref:Uncharacterized protein n=1 Tax=Pristionchus mayeri TaxID=1317129 RepID=A0AAN5CI24_9BILA|nr:hypothetical protein PMAYCL1PPCAC_15005 [Pristionchus mayeri]